MPVSETESPPAVVDAGRSHPGRPRGQAAGDVRAALLEAARQLFARHGFAAVKVRQIAVEAGTTAAMIHYYFGDKQGLYDALIEQIVAPVFQRLETLAQSQVDSTTALAELLGRYMRTLAAHPWLPALVLREVIAEGGPLRRRFIQQRLPNGSLLVQLIRRGQQAGRIRADLDPALAALSFISMAVFPFAALPVASEVFGVAGQGDALERLIAHTTQLFMTGILPAEQTS